MAADSETLGFQADEDVVRCVERYRDVRGHDNRSDALRELTEIGLREQSNPLLYRLKDRVVDWISMFGVAAVIVFLAGATTAMPMYAAVKFAVSMLIASVLLLACYELARVAAGTSAVGQHVRHILAGVFSS